LETELKRTMCNRALGFLAVVSVRESVFDGADPSGKAGWGWKDLKRGLEGFGYQVSGSRYNQRRSRSSGCEAEGSEGSSEEKVFGK
jgi:hypothetical protein